MNQGHNPHTFTLSSDANAKLSPTLSPSQLNATFVSYPPTENVSVLAGATGWANFTLGANTGFDSFEFVSVVPYQFQAGMWGFLNVSSTSPGYVVDENTTNSFAFVPAVLYVPTSQYPANLAVHLTNLGQLAHTFTVAAQAGVNLTTVDYFASHAPLENQSVPPPTPTKMTVWANFSVPAKGVYEYVCTVPGHFANGMYGYLYVGVTPPPPPAAPSTALVNTWILVGSTGLLAIGVLLVVAAAFTGRFPRTP